MTDIVERLRTSAEKQRTGTTVHWTDLRDAADEIERLRRDIREAWEQGRKVGLLKGLGEMRERCAHLVEDTEDWVHYSDAAAAIRALPLEGPYKKP